MNDEIIITGIRYISQNTIKQGKYYKADKARDWNSLVFILDGNMLYQSEHGTWHYPAGTLFLVEHNRGEIVMPEEQSVSYIYIDFFSDTIIEQEDFLPVHPLEFRELFFDIMFLWNTQQPCWRLRLMELIYGIFYRIKFEQVIRTSNYHKYQKISPALLRIAQGFASPLECTELAALCGVSVSSLNRLFREITGRSPTQYISDIRINYAKNELVNGFLNISELAERCGYADVYTFSHAFKRKVGVAPSEYTLKK